MLKKSRAAKRHEAIEIRHQCFFLTARAQGSFREASVVYPRLLHFDHRRTRPDHPPHGRPGRLCVLIPHAVRATAAADPSVDRRSIREIFFDKNRRDEAASGREGGSEARLHGNYRDGKRGSHLVRTLAEYAYNTLNSCLFDLQQGLPTEFQANKIQ